MLTKQERKAIATRIKGVYSFNYAAVYESITGERLPNETSVRDDLEKLFPIVLDLCDTSNMLELPLDKDGEVICPGDTVYIGDGIKYEVAGYMMRGNNTEVILAAGAEPVYTKEPANSITHKTPVTIASLVRKIRHLLTTEDISDELSDKIWELTDLVEMSGDSDD